MPDGSLPIKEDMHPPMAGAIGTPTKSKNSYLLDQGSSTLNWLSQRTLSNNFPALIPYITPTSHVLDIGCGPGSLTLEFAELSPQGTVVGMDVSEVPIAKAREVAEKLGVTNVEWVLGDVYDAPQIFGEERKFDIVFAHQVFQYLRDPARAMRALRRVIKPGGYIAIREWDQSSLSFWPPSPLMSLSLQIRAYRAKEKGTDMDAGRRLLGWALEAGWKEDDVWTGASTWCSGNKLERVAWGDTTAQLARDAPYRMSLDDEGEGAQTDDKEMKEKVARAWEEWGRTEGAWLAVLHGEIIGKVTE